VFSTFFFKITAVHDHIRELILLPLTVFFLEGKDL